jgi:hypothetical protein
MHRQVVIDLLLECLGDRSNQSDPSRFTGLEAGDWSAVAQLAAAQYVRPLLYHQLRAKRIDRFVPGGILKALGDAYRQNATRNLWLYGKLKRILDHMGAEGVPVVALKGLHLSAGVYDHLALRVIGDLDILVPRKGLPKAVDALSALGYQPLEPFSIHTDLARCHHITQFQDDDRLPVEIHWSITRPNRPYAIEVAELWERVTPTHSLGFEFLGLSPEDLLLHLCLHASYQHHFAFGLRSVCDIAQVIRHFDEALDWQGVRTRAARWGWQRGVYLALRSAKHMLGAAVSEESLRALKPGTFDEGLVHTAAAQVFTDRGFSSSLSNTLVQIFNREAFWERVKHLFKSVFKSRLAMAKQYSLSPNSLKCYLYYFVRIKDVFLRHAPKAWRLQRGDPELCQLALRKRTLSTWLLEDSL